MMPNSLCFVVLKSIEMVIIDLQMLHQKFCIEHALGFFMFDLVNVTLMFIFPFFLSRFGNFQIKAALGFFRGKSFTMP